MEEGEQVESGLELGQLGVVGGRDKSDKPHPFHSVIGLGLDNTNHECLQVSGMMGVLTTSSFADATERYYSEEVEISAGRLHTL